MAVGRPRAFDTEKALDQALRVFWRKGYEGATLPDLTKAMGINRPSLYAAFGNKEALFRRAIDRYVAGPACHLQEALAEPTARRVVESLFRGSIDLITDPQHPGGCFMVQSALACGDEGEAVRREVARHRVAMVTALRKRFEQAVREGDLPSNISPADFARYIVTISHGMAVHAAGGADRRELRRVAQLAMRAWPTEEQSRRPQRPRRRSRSTNRRS